MAEKVRASEQVLGVTGLSIWGGVLGEEYLTALKGTRKAKVFQEMQQDAVVATLLDSITMPLMAAEFDVTPAGSTSRDKENADFLWECMNDMTRYTWRQHVMDMLTMMAWGWSVSEMVFKKRLGMNGDRPSQYNDGKIGLHILDPRGQETLYRWKMDDEYNVEAMEQKDPNSSRIIEIESWKLLHATFRSRKRSPEGSSPLRSLYRAWYTRKNLEIIEAIGAERDLCGLPVVRLPYGATENDKAAAETLIRNIRQDEEAGLVIPAPPSSDNSMPGWGVELLSSPGSKQFDVRSIINDLNKIILMRFFAQFLMLGMEQVGTQALVEGSQDFFSLCLKSVQQEMIETWNMQLVPLLFQLNPQLMTGASGLPKIDWADPGSKDAQKIVNLVTSMISSQILTPEQELEDYLRAMTGLPDRPAGVGEGPRTPGPLGGGPFGGFMNYEWMQMPNGAWIAKPREAKFSMSTSRGYDNVVDYFHNYEHSPEGENHCVGSESNPYEISHLDGKHVISLKYARGHGVGNRPQWFYFPRVLDGGFELESGQPLDDVPAKGLWNVTIEQVSQGQQFVSDRSCMVAIPIEPDLASRLAVEGGLAPDDMHITLTYHGKEMDDSQVATIARLTKAVCDDTTPFRVIGLKATTFPVNDDGLVPYVVAVQSPGLMEFRARLAKTFDIANLEYSKDYEYQPHVTLKYLKEGEELPEISPQYDWLVDRVAVCLGEKRWPFAFGASYAQPDPGDVHIPTAMPGKKRRDQCMRCSATPAVDVIWGDGPYRAWFCSSHYKEWSVESETHISHHTRIVDGVVPEQFGDEDYEEASSYAEIAGIRGRRGGSKIGNATNEYQGLLTAIYDRWTKKAQRAIVAASKGNRRATLKEVDRQLLGLAKELKLAAAKHIDEAIRLGLHGDLDKEAKRLVDKQVQENNKFVDGSLIPRMREKIASHLNDLEAQHQYELDSGGFLGLLQSMRSEPPAYAGAFWAAIFLGAGLSMIREDRQREEEGQEPRRVRWVLDPAAEHCNDSAHGHGCLGLAGVYSSWEDMPTVPAGEVTCLGNCRCHIEVETESGWQRLA
uniref:Putative ligase n=1 Tax=viral metagenome TaxID=1070528 RepID=A0A6M3JA74_9ZZZZ